MRLYFGFALVITFCISVWLFVPDQYANQHYSTVDTCKLQGKVIKVTDGDTINVLDTDKVTHKIRLAGIDAPERGQSFGKASSKHLSELVNQKTVCVDWYKDDRWGRLVGVVRFDDSDINHQMVIAGLAWHSKKYQHEQTIEDRKLYSEAEIKARSETIGLWSQPDPILPADWRSGIREPEATRKPPADYTCSSKRFCKQMNDCAEACFYLQSCGLKRLDGNSDGIPCNNLCSVQCK